MKKYSNSKTNKKIKIRRHCFLEKLSDSNLAKFQPNWFTGGRLGGYSFRENRWKRCLAEYYKTKAVNVDACQRRNNNSDTSRKRLKKRHLAETTCIIFWYTARLGHEEFKQVNLVTLIFSLTFCFFYNRYISWARFPYNPIHLLCIHSLLLKKKQRLACVAGGIV